ILGAYGRGRARPRVADEVKDRARSLRRAGRSVPEIAAALALAKSTVWLITKDMAWTPGPEGANRRAAAVRAYWREERAKRAAERERMTASAAARVGAISDRELLLVGAVAYWAEGTKSKPWNPEERLTFTNSDPDMFILYVDRGCLGVSVRRGSVPYRLMAGLWRGLIAGVNQRRLARAS